MRIITAQAQIETQPEATSPAQIPSQFPLDELTRYHPVRSLFTVKVLDVGNLSVTLSLKWRHSNPGSGNMLGGALGCIVDHAARLAAQPVLGQCELVESELRAHRAIPGKTLLVTARIIDAHADCATFHCDIHALEHKRYVWVADSQGTLSVASE